MADTVPENLSESEAWLVDAFRNASRRFEAADSVNQITEFVLDALGKTLTLQKKFGSAEEFEAARARIWETLFLIFAPRKEEKKLGAKSFARTFPKLKLESQFVDRSVGNLSDLDVSPEKDLGGQLVDWVSAGVLNDVLDALSVRAFPERGGK